LIGYVKKAKKIESFKYVFNKEKITLEQARTKMFNFINKHKKAVFEAMTDGVKKDLKFEAEEKNPNAFTKTKIEQMVNAIVEVY